VGRQRGQVIPFDTYNLFCRKGRIHGIRALQMEMRA
jgi:hypothetical protein